MFVLSEFALTKGASACSKCQRRKGVHTSLLYTSNDNFLAFHLLFRRTPRTSLRRKHDKTHQGNCICSSLQPPLALPPACMMKWPHIAPIGKIFVLELARCTHTYNIPTHVFMRILSSLWRKQLLSVAFIFFAFTPDAGCLNVFMQD